MPSFSYEASPWQIREDLPAAYRAEWQGLAQPGSWWTGAERVAIAEEVRRAQGCPLCVERKQALSPFSVDGEHAHAEASVLSDVAIDTVHRLVTDASRLSRTWVEKLAAQGVSDGHYVELLGVVVVVISIDSFHQGLGLPLEPLPMPEAGEPTGHRPAGLEHETAWVPMIQAGKAQGEDADLFSGGPQTANVIRALSLVPDAVRSLKNVSAAQYVPTWAVGDPSYSEGRALERGQIELVAGRVSALNECFY
ncbi:MAG: hypothetical protein JRH01_22205 [Deltaproteobacteria bacterium]|nr:hypothetical protein [Deltaproteobacteria bacterium]MBW2396864.1 hypothetical protein [Deltaproteobacteria bacterium]